MRMFKSVPVCLALLALAVMLISGCGGGNSSPAVISGNFFPLTAGDAWNYATAITVETPWKTFTTYGTFNRHVTGAVPITLHGETVNAIEVVQSATINTMPTTADIGPEELPVVRAVDYLFSATFHDCQEVHAYYRQSGGDSNSRPRVTLVALSENDGPIVPTPALVPYFLNPPYDGFEHNESLPFIPMPLMPPTTSVSTPMVTDKVLAYLDPANPNGLFDIYYYSAHVDFNGTAGAMSGRGRNYMLPDVGLTSSSEVNSDWAETIQVDGYWARISVTLTWLR